MNIVKKYCLRTIAIAILFVFGLCLSPLPTLAAESAPQWGYEGDLNPDAWGKISRDFATCDVGKNQSPIDITGAVTGQPVQIAFNYQSSPLAVVNNGHSIQVNYNPGSTISIDGEEYQLLQFHFHTPSEHKIAGKAAAMEAHFVHRNAAGKLAVVGVMMNEGRENPLISKIWKAIPPIGQTKAIDNITIDAAHLLPNSKSYYSYTGSLTTPPCSEGVNWAVLTTPITISSSQLQEFKKLYPIDARPIHSTNARKIELHGSV
ncbi:carbonic anhydrase [Chamaesiphon polymorphus]|uniref:carbonic anhydrase n=1 Tax=Chamaesiphon polymorphus CCALA 037 TaxID=2107692 RepID=A0A2T1GBC3_9CYAN|nr:carbonic anhydrase family protein [Chamaesiphon polymorphus]PSB54622.1 carbonate dehydratase [Chamaesiphon polymorphus CCALA 037]